VDFINPTIEIPKSTTDAGVRLVPLTPEAYQALIRPHKRAEMFGTVEPSHLSLRLSGQVSVLRTVRAHGRMTKEMQISAFDSTHPVGSWRKAWRTLTKKAGLKSPRFHDLRQTAISALGEVGVPDRLIVDIAGHFSTRTLRRYSHIQLEYRCGGGFRGGQCHKIRHKIG
jgi:integrase